MKAMLCVHYQTFERKILPEHLAMELDKRVWRLFHWYTATMPGSQLEPVPEPNIVDRPEIGIQTGVMCPVRGVITLYPQVIGI